MHRKRGGQNRSQNLILELFNLRFELVDVHRQDSKRVEVRLPQTFDLDLEHFRQMLLTPHKPPQFAGADDADADDDQVEISHGRAKTTWLIAVAMSTFARLPPLPRFTSAFILLMI